MRKGFEGLYGLARDRLLCDPLSGREENCQMDVEPAKYFVLVTKREKRACRACEKPGVVSAPLPARIIEKCLASDRIVIDTVISTYCNHTPLHRQSVILERDIGLEISRATTAEDQLWNCDRRRGPIRKRT